MFLLGPVYFVLGLVVFVSFPLCCCLVFSTSAIDCLERVIFEMTYYASSGTLNPTGSVTPQTAVYRVLAGIPVQTYLQSDDRLHVKSEKD